MVPMRKLFPALAILALAGCANLDATLADPGAAGSSEPAENAPYEIDMLACRYDVDECSRRAVTRTDETILALGDGTGSWISIVSAECRDGRCHVTDETGTEWLLEP